MIRKGKWVFAAILVAALPGQVLAVPTSFYLSQTSIETVDPRAKDTQCQNTGSSTTLVGKDNEEKIWNYLIARPLKDGTSKLTPVQAAGIMGNMQQESGFSPTAENKKSGAYGIIQWLGSRRTALEDRAKKVAKERSVSDFTQIRDDLQFQLEHIWWEMITGENPDKFEAGKFTTFFEETKSTADPRAAARSWEVTVERSGGDGNALRMGYAQEIYNRYKNKSPSTSLGGSSPGACAGGGSAVEIAVRELGTREQPTGCDDGNTSVEGSCGPIDKYTDGHLENWCADFISWVFLQAGRPFTGGYPYKNPQNAAQREAGTWRQAGTQPMQEWFDADKPDRTFIERSPTMDVKPGDVYFLTGAKPCKKCAPDFSEGGIYHVGIVEKVEGTTLHVISGNTSSGNNGNGDVVGRDTIRDYKNNRILYGVGRML